MKISFYKSFRKKNTSVFRFITFEYDVISSCILTRTIFYLFSYFSESLNRLINGLRIGKNVFFFPRSRVLHVNFRFIRTAVCETLLVCLPPNIICESRSINYFIIARFSYRPYSYSVFLMRVSQNKKTNTFRKVLSERGGNDCRKFKVKLLRVVAFY